MVTSLIRLVVSVAIIRERGFFIPIWSCTFFDIDLNLDAAVYY